MVGLGNPGPNYATTRHNLGFVVADLLADRMGEKFKVHKKSGAEVVTGRLAGRSVVLAKPRVYMNESGRQVGPLAKFYSVPPADIVVVHDELDIDFGRIRLKFGGGVAGHNGLRSVASALGTNDFQRVRIGIGRPPGRKSGASFVLENFTAAERPEVPVLCEQAADATELLIAAGPRAGPEHRPRLGLAQPLPAACRKGRADGRKECVWAAVLAGRNGYTRGMYDARTGSALHRGWHAAARRRPPMGIDRRASRPLRDDAVPAGGVPAGDQRARATTGAAGTGLADVGRAGVGRLRGLVHPGDRAVDGPARSRRPPSSAWAWSRRRWQALRAARSGRWRDGQCGLPRSTIGGPARQAGEVGGSR